MSRINIQGTIDNIRSKSNIYTPIIEAIVNSIQSIVLKKIENGKIEIILNREKVLEIDNSIPSVKTIEIRDNGIGFTQENRDSFDTFYSEYKKSIGGKGFGRFMYVKYFNNVYVNSVFKDNNATLNSRYFRFGREYEIIVDEKIEFSKAIDTYSSVTLENIKSGQNFDKQIETIARRILDKILIYFINDTFTPPTIILKEAEGNHSIVLNDFLTEINEIKLWKSKDFVLEDDKQQKFDFVAKVFKIYYPGNQKSKVSLAGHNREVTDTPLHKYIPEFEDEFFEEDENKVKRNYIIKTYILGDYLDNNVSLERETFDFPKDTKDMYFPFGQADLERKASEISKEAFGEDVQVRVQKKSEQIRNYVNELAPWHKPYLNELDMSSIPYHLKDENIELALQEVKFRKEQKTRAELKILLADPEVSHNGQMAEAISKISEIGKSDLAHYVFNRKIVLDAFRQLLKRKEDGKGELEKDIHNLIFPMGKTSENCDYQEHNLWLLDERLIFSEYVASDKKISTKKDALGEPDLVVFDKKQSFRSGDNNYSNPLTIFEFKRPKRDAYKTDDDPIMQIGKYVKDIRAGKYEMPEGLEKIKVNDFTPVYAYVICDLTSKIREFAEELHSLTKSPDDEGYFGFLRGYNMYIEVISFKKMMDDATLRNKIFFKKLHLE
ncbi:ATP-binding protein [Flavobacterium sp. Fl-77]|uniref:ATP-binding protein n=1 Tax=Flavobacterium flavipigmentatum TaxID=2893884 RepID=A0AAJ2W116_9FLAO|nr:MULTISPECIES: ATP-binding protein [unclassified Flavobacterium]MDX6182377.1 ATP-binding protein [Flavobacterium sp. Fl-33]MDX6185710.1 ATP-binding protein [Flavobacterium sp. Fl-77]